MADAYADAFFAYLRTGEVAPVLEEYGNEHGYPLPFPAERECPVCKLTPTVAQRVRNWVEKGRKNGE